ncbi:hypothetical protein HJG60_008004 [Phyllostomus discolor]|uniref:Uncharacterized protein n=1 Tax=Phyllostomus discolor TaxID=89673 RepID=A0A834ERU3_9CHIR|nr:hypothetical protein HJG60_008004 [Phyllostomus discolor]
MAQREVWVCGRGYCGLAKPLRQVFLLFFSRRRARVLSRSRRDGKPQTAEPWEGSGYSSLKSKARKKKIHLKKREKEKERDGWKKVRVKPIGRGFLLAKEEVAPSPAETWSLLAEEAPPRTPALLLHTLGRKGSSQFARSAAAPSSLLSLPSPLLLQPPPPPRFLPETSS